MEMSGMVRETDLVKWEKSLVGIKGSRKWHLQIFEIQGLFTEYLIFEGHAKFVSKGYTEGYHLSNSINQKN